MTDMQADLFDPFAPAPNKPKEGVLQTYSGVVVLARFETGQNGLRIKLTFDVAMEDEPYEQFYNLGGKSGWQTLDMGETCFVPDQPYAQFNALTTYYDFIYHAIKTDAGPELRKRSAELYDGRGPMAAALWEGIGFDMAPVIRPRAMADPMNPGEWIDGPRVLPVKGWVDSGSKLVTPADAPIGGLSVADMAKVKKAAVDATEISHFFDALMTLTAEDGTSMIDNAHVQSKLSDPTWFTSLKEG